MAKTISSDLVQYKAFAGSQAVRDELRQWLASSYPDSLNVTGGWDPVEEWGSWGIEFSCNDESVLKRLKKEWGKKGCVAERADAKRS